VITTGEENAQSCVFDHRAKSFHDRSAIVFLQNDYAILSEVITDCCKKFSVNAPIRVMRSNIVFVSINKVRRIAHHESPPFGFGNVLEVIGLIDRNLVTETIATHCLIAGGDRSRIDVRKAKGLA